MELKNLANGNGNYVLYLKLPDPGYLSHYSVWLRTGRPGDRGSIPGRGKRFFLYLCVRTSSEAHPAFCTMDTGGPFPGAKRGRSVTLSTHPHLVQRSRMSRSYSSSPPQAPPWRGLLCFYLALPQSFFLDARKLYSSKFWKEMIHQLSLRCLTRS
jgi:hypothetical protein